MHKQKKKNSKNKATQNMKIDSDQSINQQKTIEIEMYQKQKTEQKFFDGDPALVFQVGGDQSDDDEGTHQSHEEKSIHVEEQFLMSTKIHLQNGNPDQIIEDPDYQAENVEGRVLGIQENSRASGGNGRSQSQSKGSFTLHDQELFEDCVGTPLDGTNQSPIQPINTQRNIQITSLRVNTEEPAKVRTEETHAKQFIITQQNGFPDKSNDEDPRQRFQYNVYGASNINLSFEQDQNSHDICHNRDEQFYNPQQIENMKYFMQKEVLTEQKGGLNQVSNSYPQQLVKIVDGLHQRDENANIAGDENPNHFTSNKDEKIQTAGIQSLLVGIEYAGMSATSHLSQNQKGQADWAGWNSELHTAEKIAASAPAKSQNNKNLKKKQFKIQTVGENGGGGPESQEYGNQCISEASRSASSGSSDISCRQQTSHIKNDNQELLRGQKQAQRVELDQCQGYYATQFQPASNAEFNIQNGKYDQAALTAETLLNKPQQNYEIGQLRMPQNTGRSDPSRNSQNQHNEAFEQVDENQNQLARFGSSDRVLSQQNTENEEIMDQNKQLLAGQQYFTQSQIQNSLKNIEKIDEAAEAEDESNHSSSQVLRSRTNSLNQGDGNQIQMDGVGLNQQKEVTKQALLTEHGHLMEIRHLKALEAGSLLAGKVVHRALDRIHESDGDSQNHEEGDERTLSQNASRENSLRATNDHEQKVHQIFNNQESLEQGIYMKTNNPRNIQILQEQFVRNSGNYNESEAPVEALENIAYNRNDMDNQSLKDISISKRNDRGQKQLPQQVYANQNSSGFDDHKAVETANQQSSSLVNGNLKLSSSDAERILLQPCSKNSKKSNATSFNKTNNRSLNENSNQITAAPAQQVGRFALQCRDLPEAEENEMNHVKNDAPTSLANCKGNVSRDCVIEMQDVASEEEEEDDSGEHIDEADITNRENKGEDSHYSVQLNTAQGSIRSLVDASSRIGAKLHKKAGHNYRNQVSEGQECGMGMQIAQSFESRKNKRGRALDSADYVTNKNIFVAKRLNASNDFPDNTLRSSFQISDEIANTNFRSSRGPIYRHQEFKDKNSSVAKAGDDQASPASSTEQKKSLSNIQIKEILDQQYQLQVKQANPQRNKPSMSGQDEQQVCVDSSGSGDSPAIIFQGITGSEGYQNKKEIHGNGKNGNNLGNIYLIDEISKARIPNESVQTTQNNQYDPNFQNFQTEQQFLQRKRGDGAQLHGHQHLKSNVDNNHLSFEGQAAQNEHRSRSLGFNVQNQQGESKEIHSENTWRAGADAQSDSAHSQRIGAVNPIEPRNPRSCDEASSINRIDQAANFRDSENQANIQVPNRINQIPALGSQQLNSVNGDGGPHSAVFVKKESDEEIQKDADSGEQLGIIGQSEQRKDINVNYGSKNIVRQQDAEFAATQNYEITQGNKSVQIWEDDRLNIEGLQGGSEGHHHIRQAGKPRQLLDASFKDEVVSAEAYEHAKSQSIEITQSIKQTRGQSEGYEQHPIQIAAPQVRDQTHSDQYQLDQRQHDTNNEREMQNVDSDVQRIQGSPRTFNLEYEVDSGSQNTESIRSGKKYENTPGRKSSGSRKTNPKSSRSRANGRKRHCNTDSNGKKYSLETSSRHQVEKRISNSLTTDNKAEDQQNIVSVQDMKNSNEHGVINRQEDQFEVLSKKSAESFQQSTKEHIVASEGKLYKNAQSQQNSEDKQNANEVSSHHLKVDNACAIQAEDSPCFGGSILSEQQKTACQQQPIFQLQLCERNSEQTSVKSKLNKEGCQQTQQSSQKNGQQQLQNCNINLGKKSFSEENYLRLKQTPTVQNLRQLSSPHSQNDDFDRDEEALQIELYDDEKAVSLTNRQGLIKNQGLDSSLKGSIRKHSSLIENQKQILATSNAEMDEKSGIQQPNYFVQEAHDSCSSGDQGEQHNLKENVTPEQQRSVCIQKLVDDKFVAQEDHIQSENVLLTLSSKNEQSATNQRSQRFCEAQENDQKSFYFDQNNSPKQNLDKDLQKGDFLNSVDQESDRRSRNDAKLANNQGEELYFQNASPAQLSEAAGLTLRKSQSNSNFAQKIISRNIQISPMVNADQLQNAGQQQNDTSLHTQKIFTQNAQPPEVNYRNDGRVYFFGTQKEVKMGFDRSEQQIKAAGSNANKEIKKNAFKSQVSKYQPKGSLKPAGTSARSSLAQSIPAGLPTAKRSANVESPDSKKRNSVSLTGGGVPLQLSNLANIGSSGPENEGCHTYRKVPQNNDCNYQDSNQSNGNQMNDKGNSRFVIKKLNEEELERNEQDSKRAQAISAIHNNLDSICEKQNFNNHFVDQEVEKVFSSKNNMYFATEARVKEISEGLFIQNNNGCIGGISGQQKMNKMMYNQSHKYKLANTKSINSNEKKDKFQEQQLGSENQQVYYNQETSILFDNEDSPVYRPDQQFQLHSKDNAGLQQIQRVPPIKNDQTQKLVGVNDFMGSKRELQEGQSKLFETPNFAYEDYHAVQRRQNGFDPNIMIRNIENQGQKERLSDNQISQQNEMREPSEYRPFRPQQYKLNSNASNIDQPQARKNYEQHAMHGFESGRNLNSHPHQSNTLKPHPDHKKNPIAESVKLMHQEGHEHQSNYQQVPSNYPHWNYQRQQQAPQLSNSNFQGLQSPFYGNQSLPYQDQILREKLRPNPYWQANSPHHQLLASPNNFQDYYAHQLHDLPRQDIQFHPPMYGYNLQGSNQLDEALCVQNLLRSQEDMLWDMMRARQSQFTRENTYLQDQLLQLQQYQKRILQTQNDNLIRARIAQQNLCQQEFIGMKNFNHQVQNSNQIHEQNLILKQQLANQSYLLSQQQEQIKILQGNMAIKFGSQLHRQQQTYEVQHGFPQASQQSHLQRETTKNPQQMSSNQQLQGNFQWQAAVQKQKNYQNAPSELHSGVGSGGNIYLPYGAQDLVQQTMDQRKVSQSAVDDTYPHYRYPSTNTLFENFETEQAIQEHNIIRQVQDFNKGSVDKKSQIYLEGENSHQLRYEGQESPERSNYSNQIPQYKISREIMASRGYAATNEQEQQQFQHQFNQISLIGSQTQQNQNYVQPFAPGGSDTHFI